MAYGNPATDEIEAPSVGGDIMLGGARDAGQQIAEQELQQSMGMTAEQIAQERASIDQIIAQGANENRVASEMLAQIPPHLHGLAQERIQAVMQQAGRDPNETAQVRDERVAEEQRQIQQAIGGAIGLGTGFSLFALGDPDATNKDRVAGYEALGAAGINTGLGGTAGVLATLAPEKIAILTPGTKYAAIDEGALSELAPMAGTPQPGLAIAQAQKNEKQTGEYVRRPGA